MKTRKKREAKTRQGENTISREDAARAEAVAETPQSLWARLRELDWSLVALMLAIKLIVFVYGVHAFYLTTNNSAASPHGWLDIWNRWDAPHYLDIASNGYAASGEQRYWLVFYPLYPWLTRAFAFVTGGDYLVAALLVSTVASVAAGLLLHRLALLDDADAVARRAVWFLFIFPTSYFLHVGYTESLFIALSVGCFLSARTGRWRAAGILGALAGLTRVNGLILIPALMVEAFTQYRETRRFKPEWLWSLSALVGFGVYLLINRHVAGDAFAFQRLASEHWDKTLAPPWVGLRETVTAIWRLPPARAQLVGVEELFFAALGLACTIWCAKVFRPSYAVWMGLNWLLWTSTASVLSVPRYTLIMFPVYLLFARLATARPLWGKLVMVWSLMLLALFVSQFVQWSWAF
jgi:hypothetical protein